MRDPVQQRLGPKPFRPRSPPQGNGQYDSGLERDEQPLKKPQSIDGSEAETEVSLQPSFLRILDKTLMESSNRACEPKRTLCSIKNHAWS